MCMSERHTSRPEHKEETRQRELFGSGTLPQLTRQRQGLSSAMSATESNIQLLLQLSVAPASDLLVQFIQQRQALSNAMSATESNSQLMLPQPFDAPAQNPSASSPVSHVRILHGLESYGFPRPLLQR